MFQKISQEASHNLGSCLTSQHLRLFLGLSPAGVEGLEVWKVQQEVMVEHGQQSGHNIMFVL